ncbi:Methyltransferase-related protein [Zostera marina]|uniref:Methyltransferase-related protein n=1 Tax=Zostera marina TaxID=29655 RepID=A0A0K9NXY4_ZOSMR|nr:Methyltransferase-related protein [Zostera marina]
MCPLRILLIFISATLAGFFLLRNIGVDNNLEEAGEQQQPKRTEEEEEEEEEEEKEKGKPNSNHTQSLESTSTYKKRFLSFIILAFWTMVDMASGRYLWRNLISSDIKTAAVSATTLPHPKKLQ